MPMSCEALCLHLTYLLTCTLCECRWRAVYRVIPDERPLIEQTLKELVSWGTLWMEFTSALALQTSALSILSTQCDKEGCCLVVTTGGTGPAPRDVTPDATEAVATPPSFCILLNLVVCFS